MSYLTGPNRAELIPIRLDIVTLNNSLSDAELKELARGDVRAVLTQFPDLRQAIVNDYVRGSSVGKHFSKKVPKCSTLNSPIRCEARSNPHDGLTGCIVHWNGNSLL